MLPFDYEVLEDCSPVLIDDSAEMTAATRTRLAECQAAINACLALREGNMSLEGAHTAIACWARHSSAFLDYPPSDLSKAQQVRCKRVHDSLMAICVTLVRSMRYEWVQSG